MTTYVYTLLDCGACDRAKRLVTERWGSVPVVVPIDNPLLEMGVQLLFRDGQVHAPVVVVPGDGVYLLGPGSDGQLLRLVSLAAGRAAEPVGGAV